MSQEKKRIKVCITATQTVRYVQEKEILQEDYDEYLAAIEGHIDEERIRRAIEPYIRLDDVCDADEMEEIEVQPVRQKRSGR